MQTCRATQEGRKALRVLLPAIYRLQLSCKIMLPLEAQGGIEISPMVEDPRDRDIVRKTRISKALWMAAAVVAVKQVKAQATRSQCSVSVSALTVSLNSAESGWMDFRLSGKRCARPPSRLDRASRFPLTRTSSGRCSQASSTQARPSRARILVRRASLHGHALLAERNSTSLSFAQSGSQPNQTCEIRFIPPLLILSGEADGHVRPRSWPKLRAPSRTFTRLASFTETYERSASVLFMLLYPSLITLVDVRRAS